MTYRGDEMRAFAARLSTWRVAEEGRRGFTLSPRPVEDAAAVPTSVASAVKGRDSRNRCGASPQEGLKRILR
jgi:hypothetical protein